MSEKDSIQSTPNQHKDLQISKQDCLQATSLQRPVNDDKGAWIAYWKAQGQVWRTEPEISPERQEVLTRQRVIVPDIEKGIYPFKGMKLDRSDVEWLLEQHIHGCKPMNWYNEKDSENIGLDLRGAYLQQVNLSRLPLTGLHGALDWEEWLLATSEQREAAVIHLEKANLSFTHLVQHGIEKGRKSECSNTQQDVLREMVFHGIA